MIKLVIDGTCKGCPWQDIRLMGTSARCIHDYLCKYITYTDFSWDDWEREQIRKEEPAEQDG